MYKKYLLYIFASAGKLSMLPHYEIDFNSLNSELFFNEFVINVEN